GAARSLLHDGRQSRQFDRQPGREPGRLCAARKPGRSRANHLFLDPGRRARLGNLALALVGALEPPVHDRAMSRRPKGKDITPRQGSDESAGGAPTSINSSAPRPPAAKETKRRKRGAAGFEAQIGYRFRNAALLEQALTHISALAGARNRSGSYQRLEFLGDHVLGLVISDMLFRAFPKADEGELSRRLADLVRKEAC